MVKYKPINHLESIIVTAIALVISLLWSDYIIELVTSIFPKADGLASKAFVNVLTTIFLICMIIFVIKIVPGGDN